MAAYGDEKFLTFLFSPSGRTCRAEYWYRYLLPYMGISFVANLLDLVVMGPQIGIEREVGPFSGITALFYAWPSIAVTAKRFHDRGMSGWWIIGQVLPLLIAAGVFAFIGGPQANGSDAARIVGIFVLVAAVGFWLYFVVQVLFLRGQPHDNKYGSDPLGNSADVFS